MQRDPTREGTTEGPPPNPPRGEMAVVADPDDPEESVRDEDMPDTIPDPRPLPPFEEESSEESGPDLG